MNEDALPSYETYLEIQKGIGNVLSEYPKSHAYFDYFRAVKAREGYNKWLKGKPLTKEEIKSYFTVSINPMRGEEFTKKQYDRLLQVYGSSAVKISMIDNNLKKWLESSNESQRVLSTGGACALESIDTKRIIELAKKDASLPKKYIEEMFLRFPTWTQITGALIPSRVSVFYDETFPWHLKISDYGISNSELKTQRIYDRIFFTLQRFVKLHNPQNIILRLPFITLNLAEDGILNEWFNEYKKNIEDIDNTYKFAVDTYDPDRNYKAWIQYTYMGPKILKIALEKLKQQYPKLYKVNNLDTYTIHVRGKQLDHFDIERLNLWMHRALVGNTQANGSAQIRKLLSNPLMRDVTAMYSWARDSLKESQTIGNAGFLDFNYKGKLIHEDRLFTLKEVQGEGNKAMMEHLTDSPLRLHSRNLPEVMKLLDRFKRPYSVSFSKEIMKELSTLNVKLDQKERKIIILRKFIKYSDFFISLFEQLLKENKITVTNSSKEIIEMLHFLISRYRSDNHLINLIKKENQDKKENMSILEKKLFKMIELATVKGKTVIILRDTELVLGMYTQLLTNLKEDVLRCSEYIEESQFFTKKIRDITHNISKNIIKYEADYLTNHVNILPLSDNLFASYMQQLLFIPSIQNAYLDMIAIQSNRELTKEQKEQAVIEIINKIYYVVEACLLYIFKNTSYPWEARFESYYERQY
jgi:hypothetical protein